MTIDEKNYARSRVFDIKQLKLAAIRKKHTVEREKLSHKQKAAMIAGGKVKLLKDPPRDHYCEQNDVEEYFDFSAFETQFDDKAYAKEIAPLEKEATRITDLIVLGNAAEALALIAEFEKI